MNVKSILKIELERMFHSLTFYVSLGIGLLITMTQFAVVGLKNSFDIVGGYTPYTISEPYGVFGSFFGLSGPPLVYRKIYYIILPLLSVFAYATTYCSDRNSGYVKNLYTRTDKKYYYAAKYIVSCLAGGIVATVPLAVNLIANMLVLPSLDPVVAIGSYSTLGVDMWVNILYTHPYLFVFMYLLLIFCYQFVYVSVALLISEWVDNRFLITVFPFLLNYFIYMLLSFFHAQKFSPIIIVDMARISNLDFWWVLLEWICLIVFIGGMYFWNQKKDEGL